ncbi:MAG: hypothetical protein KDA46_02035 [Parvularculaceae bacterium]|nr:hypothetical protein [Parvularculaceae bacterium]
MAGLLIGLVIAVLALCAAYWRWAKKVDGEIATGAGVEWARLQSADPAIIDGLSEDEFTAVYRRVHFPRFPKYALAAIAGFTLALPFVFALLSFAYWAGEATGVLASPSELSQMTPISGAAVLAAQESREDVAMYLAQNFFGFFYFFGILAAWLAIVAAVMHRYHSRQPGYLRDELIRVRLKKEDE